MNIKTVLGLCFYESGQKERGLTYLEDVVAKRPEDGRVRSDVTPVAGEARVAEVARMLGGERLSGTSLAHAQEMLSVGSTPAPGRKARKP